MWEVMAHSHESDLRVVHLRKSRLGIWRSLLNRKLRRVTRKQQLPRKKMKMMKTMITMSRSLRSYSTKMTKMRKIMRILKEPTKNILQMKDEKVLLKEKKMMITSMRKKCLILQRSASSNWQKASFNQR